MCPHNSNPDPKETTMKRFTRTQNEARSFLLARYAEECLLFPTLRHDIPEELYVRRNLKAAQEYYQGDQC